MKMITQKNNFEKDDICTCQIDYLNKKREIIYTYENLYCGIRNNSYLNSCPRKMAKREFKKVELIKVTLLKKIGSKAIL